MPSRVLALGASVAILASLAVSYALPANAHVLPSTPHLFSPYTELETYTPWDGVQAIEPFGCPDTTTYGQVITIPAGNTALFEFTFPWINLTSGSLKFRGEVYAWDGSEATGPALYESDPARPFSFSNGLFHDVSFYLPGVPVTPGKQYVLFVSIDKEYESCLQNYQVGWGYVDDSAYTGGFFVYQNNAGDESKWTTMPWTSVGLDLTFEAVLR